MAKKENTDKSTWLSKSQSFNSSDTQLYVRGVPFTVDRDLLAAKSAKVSAIILENPKSDISHSLRDIPGDPAAFELLARFCHGYAMKISTENVIPLIVLACYFEMTENHSENNLVKGALTFFEQKIIPSWNETIKALSTSEHVLQQAVHLGLMDSCIQSIVEKALIDPRYLGEPVKNLDFDSENSEEEDFRPNARRRLFDNDWKLEDLTRLSPQLYEPIINSMNQNGVPSKYVAAAASLCEYEKKWVLSGDDMSIYARNSRRDIIEAVERLLPNDKGLFPCTLLFQKLRAAIGLKASLECMTGFEQRIGKQLEFATVKDLLIPSQGYAKEVQYDIECLKRIMKNFYGNYSSSDSSGLITVAELMEDLLIEISSDIDLKISTFTSLADLALSVAHGINLNSDGIYRAIDIYLDKHRFLTETEKEEVCRVLDCQKTSAEACGHAAKNERLPLRVVVQILFAAQLQLRDEFKREAIDSRDVFRNSEIDEEEEAKMEMEKTSVKVMELEEECRLMKKEIDNSRYEDDKNSSIVTISKKKKKKKKNGGMWRKIKRKLGCMTTNLQDYQYQVIKKNKF
ncbi:hypothetical protein ACFE04_027161 [Oxalis oulophora]